MKEQIQKWLDSNYKNFLNKNQGRGLPQSELDHILDWMMSKDAESYLPRLDRVSVPAAKDLSVKWTLKLNKTNEKLLKIKEDLNGAEMVYQCADGYYVVKLRSEDSFKREGVKMGHCVGTYYTSSEADLEIYSLRDPNNEPHCTIEFTPSNRTIEQVKGKANTAVVEKYRKYVVQFLNSFDFDDIYSYDLKNISSIYFGNYIFLNDEIPANLEVPKSLKIDQVNYIHSFDKLVINGDALLSRNRRCKKIAKTLIVKGDLVLEEFHGLLKVADELIVEGDIQIDNCENLKLLADKVTAKNVAIYDCEHFSQKIQITGIVEVHS